MSSVRRGAAGDVVGSITGAGEAGGGVGATSGSSGGPVLDALVGEEPAILIEGPRGSGKSTIMREVAAGRPARVIDLDDGAVLSVVREDPVSALIFDGLVVIDEFQRAPAVLSVVNVKRVVDETLAPGRFLLAGSVGTSLLPTGSETLTGKAVLGVGRLAPTRGCAGGDGWRFWG